MSNLNTKLEFKNFHNIYFQFREDVGRDLPNSSTYNLSKQYAESVPYCGDGCSEEVGRKAFELICEYYKNIETMNNQSYTTKETSLDELKTQFIKRMKSKLLLGEFHVNPNWGSNFNVVIENVQIFGRIDLNRKSVQIECPFDIHLEEKERETICKHYSSNGLNGQIEGLQREIDRLQISLQDLKRIERSIKGVKE